MSLEPEYERLHRKMHAQLREIYRQNGGLPILEEFRTAALLQERQLMMSYGLISSDECRTEAAMGDSLMRSGGEEIIQRKDLQDAIDSASRTARELGIPVRIDLRNYTGSGYIQPPPAQAEIVKETEPPDGVHVLPGPRVGDEQKNEYLERLREAAGGGYINLTETGARQDAMLKAESREDLERLVKDLPPYKPDIPGTKIYPEKKEPRTWVYSAAAVMMSLGMLLSMVFLTLTTGAGEIMFVVCWVFAVLFGAKAGWSYLLGHRKDIS